ncbi:hypothetical protein XENORESO_004965 [Xenotaenia resolanae]|uniref:Uncharacterized protein n=1 Tax=Xenotaenia resolanae TaxID=208358 RepID=A0ABV0VTZ4_9TELE
MKPELRPPSLTRKAGSSLSEGLHNLSILLSLMEASSWTAMDRKSRAFQRKYGVRSGIKSTKTIKLFYYPQTFAGYSPWKFPPEMVSPRSANTILYGH